MSPVDLDLSVKIFTAGPVEAALPSNRRRLRHQDGRRLPTRSPGCLRLGLLYRQLVNNALRNESSSIQEAQG